VASNSAFLQRERPLAKARKRAEFWSSNCENQDGRTIPPGTQRNRTHPPARAMTDCARLASPGKRKSPGCAFRYARYFAGSSSMRQ
jgi:hypothetical protein